MLPVMPSSPTPKPFFCLSFSVIDFLLLLKEQEDSRIKMDSAKLHHPPVLGRFVPPIPAALLLCYPRMATTASPALDGRTRRSTLPAPCALPSPERRPSAAFTGPVSLTLFDPPPLPPNLLLLLGPRWTFLFYFSLFPFYGIVIASYHCPKLTVTT